MGLQPLIERRSERLASVLSSCDFVRCSKSFRSEDKVEQVLKQHGEHPGLVWVFSTMEPYPVYRPLHDKATSRTYLHLNDGKCPHDQFYLIDDACESATSAFPPGASSRCKFI